MPTLRAFIAVRIASPGDALAGVLRKLSRGGRAVNAVDRDRLHLTLRFLGDIDADLLPWVTAAVDAAAAAVSPFRVTLRGVGAFPHAGRPRVIWAGVEDATPLDALAAHLDSGLAGIDIPERDKPFTAHLTLARVKAKPPRECFELLERETDTPFGEHAIDAVHLIESQLTRQGPVYTDRHVAPLRG